MFRKIIAYLLFISSFLFFVLFFLLEGLTIESLSLPGVKIKQLYIKLDKKLILEADKIVISKKSNVKHSFDDMKKDIQKLPAYIKYFQKLHIEDLQIDGNNFVIEINDEILYIDNKYINISAKPTYNENSVTMELYSLYLKDFDTLLNGNITVDLVYNNTNFIGTYLKGDAKGKLTLSSKNGYLDFYVDSNEMGNIHLVKDFVRLDPVIEKWMYDNVLGIYSLKNLSGRFSTFNFQPLMRSFKGIATVKDAKIRFHDDVDYINTKEVVVKFENDNLSFDLLEPKYKDIDINGSNVVIYNISGSGSNIDVNLVTQHRLNQDILDIIKAYGADVPIRQLDGITDSKLTINVDFKTSNVTTNGTFTSKKANFKINGLSFLAKDATVKLQNNKLNIENTHVTYKDNLEGVMDLYIDTAASKANGKMKIDFFKINKDNTNIIEIKNEISNFDVKFSNNVNIYLKELLTSININENAIDVKIDKLDTIYEKSGLLKELKVKYGTLFLSIYELDDIKLEANIFNVDLPIKRDDERISSLNIVGTIKADDINIDTIDKKLSLHIDEKVIDLTLRDTDVIFESGVSFDKVDKEITLKFDNSNIEIKDIYSFNTNKFKIVKNNIGLEFAGNVIRPDVPILKDGKNIEEIEITGRYVNKKLNITSDDRKIHLEVKENEDIILNIQDYDVLYDTTKESKLKDQKLVLTGKNSSVVINHKYKLLSNKYNFTYKNNEIMFDSFYKKSHVNLKEDSSGQMVINGSSLNDELVNAFLDENLISGGTLNVSAIGLNKNLNGKISLKDTKIKNLTFLNNLILFLNTSPALLNPFFAIPAAVDIIRNKGISINGYDLENGNIEFNYDLNKSVFNASKIYTEGSLIDFDGYAILDFDKDKIDSKMNVSFLKAYSSIVKQIPIIGYIFLGDDKKVTTEVDISGHLDDPQYTTNLVEESSSVPLNILRRIINLPSKAIDSIMD